MTPSTLADFLALPWSPKVRAGIQATLDAPGTRVLVARQVPGNPPRAMVYPRIPASLPADAIALYRKPAAKPASGPQARRSAPAPTSAPSRGSGRPQEAISRTAQALALVDAGATATEAAQTVGISPPAVFQALARRARARRCPHCGQTLGRAAYPVQPDA